MATALMPAPTAPPMYCYAGVSNKFHEDTLDPLSVKHKSDSPNEREHAEIACKLLQNHNLLQEPEASLVQSFIPELLLKTDMKASINIVASMHIKTARVQALQVYSLLG